MAFPEATRVSEFPPLSTAKGLTCQKFNNRGVAILALSAISFCTCAILYRPPPTKPRRLCKLPLVEEPQGAVSSFNTKASGVVFRD
jgi:hypothetical protein